MSRELAPVRVAFVEPVTRSGTGVHQGVTLGVGDSVLVAGQIVDPENNGVYLVQSGAWTRRADFNAGSESATPNMLPGSWLRALEGHYQGSYYFANAFIPQAGLSVINWYRENYGATLTGGSGVVIDQANATVALRERVGVQGTYTNPVVTLDAHGVADDAFSGDFDPSHALGLAMEWRSATAVAVGPGSVWIPGTGAGELLVVGAPIVKTGLVLPASSWVSRTYGPTPGRRTSNSRPPRRSSTTGSPATSPATPPAGTSRWGPCGRTPPGTSAASGTRATSAAGS